MDFLKLFEVICLLSVASGAVLLMFPKRLGLYLFNVGNFFSAIVYSFTGLYYLLALVLFLTLTNSIAIFVWKKKRIG